MEETVMHMIVRLQFHLHAVPVDIKKRPWIVLYAQGEFFDHLHIHVYSGKKLPADLLLQLPDILFVNPAFTRDINSQVCPVPVGGYTRNTDKLHQPGQFTFQFQSGKYVIKCFFHFTSCCLLSQQAAPGEPRAIGPPAPSVSLHRRGSGGRHRFLLQYRDPLPSPLRGR